MVMRYRDGKWQNDVMPEDIAFGGSFTNKIQGQALTGSMNSGFAPTWQYNRDIPAAPAQEVSAPSNWATNGTGTTQLSQLLNQTATPATPTAYATTAPQGNAFSSAMNDYLKGGAPTAPTGNSFADPMKQYLASGAPQAPTSNAFADPIKQYLGTAAPTADKAVMGTNRYAGGLSQAEQRLQDLITNPGALEKSAAYRFRFNQGQEALQRSMGARGMLNSGNRLTELTKYGQDMGSQEYEAENARRKALLDTYAQNFNADEAADTARFGTESAANNARFGIQTDQWKTQGQTLADLYKGAETSNNQRYATAADLYGKQGTTLSNLFKTEADANAARYGTDMDAYTRKGQTLASLYGNENAANTSRYGTDVGAATSRYATDVGANTAKANTLADLYRTDVNASVQQTSPTPWWVGKYDQYGRPIARG